MTTAPDWQPGDPLLVDNGCGSVPSLLMTPDQRQAAIAADPGTPPPWWRPEPEAPRTPGNWARSCEACGVCWTGDTPCWMCGGQETPR